MKLNANLGFGGAFRQRVWLDRYLVLVCLVAALVAVSAFQKGYAGKGLASVTVAALAVALAPRPGIVLAAAAGFVALQSLFSVVARQDERGLPITLVALALASGGLIYASKKGERWPEGSSDFGSLGLAIDAAVFLSLLWVAIQFT